MREIGTPGGRYVHVNHRLQIARKNKKRLKFSFSKLGSAAYGILRRPIIQNVLTVVWPDLIFDEVQGPKINRKNVFYLSSGW